MNVRTMIDSAGATLDTSARPRMVAAMELGARFALEAVLAKNAYSSDVQEVLADLDGKMPALAPEPEPAPAGALEPGPSF